MAPRKKPTTSSGEAQDQAPHIAAGVAPDNVLQSASTKEKSNHMSDENQSSIVEYDTDISEAEAPPPLPAREYTAEIRAAVRKTGQSGKDYAAVSFFISPDQYPADFTDGNPDGTILIFRRVSLENTPSGRWQMRKFCEAIKAPMSKKLDLNEWIGLTATVHIGHDPYEGEMRANIVKVTEA